jgi:hypothetical protein
MKKPNSIWTTVNLKQLPPATREDKLFLVLFLVAVLGGAIRKWFTTSGAVANGVLFVQMVIPFLMFFFRSGRAVSPFGKYGILGIYFFYMLIHIFHPWQPTLYHGILGMLVHGLFWIGIFYYISNRALFHPYRYLRLMFILCAVEIFLAFIQYSLPSSHILNRYANEKVGIAMIADRVRVSGTFSYLSGYTAFLLFYPFFVWALIRFRISTWIVALATSFGLFASFMTGSRGGTLLYLLFTGAMIIQAYKLSDLGKLVLRLLIPTLVGVALLMVTKSVTIADQIEGAYERFAERVTQNRARGEEAQRLTGDFDYFQGNRFRDPWFGIGVGSTYQGAIILFGWSRYHLEFGYVESEFVKVILEGGIVMILLKILLATILVSQLSFTSRVLKFFTWFTLVYAAPIVYNVHNAAFLMMGIILVDNIIWRQNNEVNRQRAAAARAASEGQEAQEVPAHEG